MSNRRSRSTSRRGRRGSTNPEFKTGSGTASDGVSPDKKSNSSSGDASPGPEAGNLVPELNTEDIAKGIARQMWTCAEFKQRIDKSIASGKITGAVVSGMFLSGLVGSIFWYFDSVSKLFVQDETSLYRMRHINKNLNMERAYEIVVEMERNHSAMIKEFQQYNVSGANATKLINEYVQTNHRTCEYLIELIDRYNATNQTQMLAAEYTAFLEQIRNDTISDAALVAIVDGQKIAARYVYEGLPVIEEDLIKGRKLDNMLKTVAANQNSTMSKLEELKNATLLSAESQQLFSQTQERLGVKTSTAVFLQKIIKELEFLAQKSTSGIFSLTASFLMSKTGLILVSSVANSLEPLIEMRMNQIMQDENVTVMANETSAQWSERRAQVAARVVARLGYFISGDSALMLAGAAMATDTLHLTLITSIISAGFAGGERIVKSWKKALLETIRTDIKNKCKYTTGPKLEYKTGQDPDKYLDSRRMHIQIFALAMFQRFFKTTRMPLALYSFFPTVAGACVFSIGYASSYAVSIYEASNLTTVASTVLSVSKFNQATVYIPAGMALSFAVYDVIQDAAAQETDDISEKVSSGFLDMLKSAGMQLLNNVEWVHWGLGAMSMGFVLSNQPLNPQNLLWSSIFGNYTFLGKKNDTNVLFERIREQPKEWETKRPQLLLRLRYK